jgi:PilZ domain
MTSRGPAQERRKKPRVSRRLPVRFGSEARMCGGQVLDIAEGGLRVQAPDSFPVNSIVQVFVQFPRHAIRLRARVAWCSSGEGSKPTLGLAFTGPEPKLAQTYAHWIAEVKTAVKEEGGVDGFADPAAASGDTGGAAPPAEDAAPPAAAAPTPSPAPPAPEPTGPVRRRMETRSGQAYDVLMERGAAGWQLTIVQLPRQIGVDAPDLKGTYPDYATAEAKLLEFVRSH